MLSAVKPEPTEDEAVAAASTEPRDWSVKRTSLRVPAARVPTQTVEGATAKPHLGWQKKR